ncbi:MAG TPA: response regulator [Chryseolinea sp.]|nr:response regulator [Chryseolinea sp.]
MKILIVDDEELDLFITQKFLSLEFETEGFSALNQAVAWAQQNDFDVALIDYYLGPDVYATTLLSQLLTIKGKSFKAFVVSNYVDDRQVLELKNAGFTDIIFKPFTLESFKKKIAAV